MVYRSARRGVYCNCDASQERERMEVNLQISSKLKISVQCSDCGADVTEMLMRTPIRATTNTGDLPDPGQKLSKVRWPYLVAILLVAAVMLTYTEDWAMRLAIFLIAVLVFTPLSFSYQSKGMVSLIFNGFRLYAGIMITLLVLKPIIEHFSS